MLAGFPFKGLCNIVLPQLEMDIQAVCFNGNWGHP